MQTAREVDAEKMIVKNCIYYITVSATLVTRQHYTMAIGDC